MAVLCAVSIRTCRGNEGRFSVPTKSKPVATMGVHAGSGHAWPPLLGSTQHAGHSVRKIDRIACVPKSLALNKKEHPRLPLDFGTPF